MAETPEESKAKYNYLGRSGLKVSNICLGTMTFGEHVRPGQSDEALAHQILNRFVEWGGNLIDTADVYCFGQSESIIGTWLERQTRENLVIATKCRLNMKRNVNSNGLSRRHITQSIEDSLGRLHTDYIDLYQPHSYDNATPVEETYRTLDDLVRCGKVRYIGVSNFSGWQMQKIVDNQKMLGLNPVVSLQQQYSLAARESEFEAFQVCKNDGIGVLAWSPLKGGLLTGKVKRGKKPTEGRVTWVAEDESRRLQSHPVWHEVSDRVFNVIDLAEKIGKLHGKSIAQVALRWVIQRDITASAVMGARTLEQLDHNMDVNNFSLSAEEMQQLDEASALDVNYPYLTINKMNADRVNTKTSDYYVKSVAS